MSSDAPEVDARRLASDQAAAVALDCSVDKVRRLRASGQLPTVRIDGLVRTTWAAIDALIAANTTKPEGAVA